MTSDKIHMEGVKTERKLTFRIMLETLQGSCIVGWLIFPWGQKSIGKDEKGIILVLEKLPRGSVCYCLHVRREGARSVVVTLS